MSFQPDPERIIWRLHLKSSPSSVYAMLATDEGRARFWAVSAIERNGVIDFQFPNGMTWKGQLLEKVPGKLYKVQYIGGSVTTFSLLPDEAGGTVLVLTDDGVPERDRTEVTAG